MGGCATLCVAVAVLRAPADGAGRERPGVAGITGPERWLRCTWERGRRALRRLAMISLHTSPLDQPGTGDAGGMNVYVVELARRLAARGVEVDVFTRATRSTRTRPSYPWPTG